MRSSNWTVVLASVAVAAACSRSPDIDKVPAGTQVQVTRDDGGLVEGKLQQVSEKSVKVDTGSTSRVVPKEQIADVRVVSDPLKKADPPPKARFREVLVPASTKLSIELDQAVSSETSRV